VAEFGAKIKDQLKQWQTVRCSSLDAKLKDNLVNGLDCRPPAQLSNMERKCADTIGTVPVPGLVIFKKERKCAQNGN